MAARRTFAGGAVLGAVLALAGCNLGTKPVNYPIGNTGLTRVVDLDGDGDTDVLTTGYGHGTLLNDGTGSLTAELVPDQWLIEESSLGDVDGDGDLDLVRDSPDGLAVARNDGGAGFGAPEPIDVPASEALDVGDVDADGHVDLVTFRYLTGVEVRRGDGTGAFGAPAGYPLGDKESYGVGEMRLVDLDDDGALDVVTTGLGFDAGGNQGFVGVLLGDGAGGFRPYRLFATAAESTNGPGLSIADLDDDGALDVVTGNTFVNAVSFLAGDGAGGFAAQVAVPTLAEPTDTAVADIDDDGHMDVVVTQGRGGAEVLFGDGAGAFSDSHEVASGGRLAAGVASADLDGDGRPDLVVGHNGADGETTSVGVLVNRLGPRS